MYRNYNNLRVFVRMNGKDSFSVYLDVSGQEHFLVRHRANYEIFESLRYGIRVEDLMAGRIQMHGKAGFPRRRLSDALRHICRVVDDYITYDLDAEKEDVIFSETSYLPGDCSRCA